MAATRNAPPRLHIPPNINAQQPMGYDMGPMFSPAMPSAMQHGFQSSFPMNSQFALQTPLQPSFSHGIPPRASHLGHNSRPSLAQLAAAGMHPGMPATPTFQYGGAPFTPGFGNRNRRAPSISLGGPPKAVLGGPGRNHSPMPVPTSAVAAASSVPTQKTKKVVVNLPRETIFDSDDAQASKQATWARIPLQPSLVPPNVDVAPPDLITADAYPQDSERYQLPDTVDVFLPGKSAWDAVKQRVIEEKLEKLGVERGSGSSVPHIHAPHARAASISSPADPALLLFKLNKLQQSQQNASSTNSLSTSPQPPLSLSTSPNPPVPPRFQNRHGHSMSLAQPLSLQPSLYYNPQASFNPFGPGATLGSDQISPRPRSAQSAAGDIIAPQGRVPVTVSSLAPPLPLARPESRPDFVRGFGLDIPEEEEPQEEAGEDGITVDESVVTEGDVGVGANGEDADQAEGQDGSTTVSGTRLHSRHVSRLSVALSLRSVGGNLDEQFNGSGEIVPVRSPVGDVMVDDLDREAVQEWTGSEDLRTGVERSDDESIGEFSNPSDEERARLQRLHRRTARRSMETPRRLPNFPRPPELGPAFVPRREDDDMVSNPSDEGDMPESNGRLGVDQNEYYPRPPSNSSGRLTRPLPPLPHSRAASGQYSYHDPALAHSRQASEGGFMYGPVQHATPRRESLNPLAKPFVFGSATGSGSFLALAPTDDTPSPPPTAPGPAQTTHTRVPSFGKPLNAAAQEFKPTFTFVPPPGATEFTFQTPDISASRPLPLLPMQPAVVRAQQGREKRQRLSPTDDMDDEEDESGRYNMSSFKFPPVSVSASPQHIRRSAPTTPPGSNKYNNMLSAGAKPFTFGGFSSFLSGEQSQSPDIAEENSFPQDLTTRAEQGSPTPGANELPIPLTYKPKRAPIPLDFKHPVSTNTVPAGLFKNLVNGNGEERTRRSVRSRLSSREVFEHSSRGSLDDTNVPTISQRVPRSRLATDPIRRESLASSGDDNNFVVRPRRSSLPALHSAGGESSLSGISIPPIANLARRDELEDYEWRLEMILDSKMEALRQDLMKFKGSDNINPSTEAMITEVVSLFRSQLQESAARDLEDSQMDARGELDFQLIKDVIEQGQAEAQAIIRRELSDIRQRVEVQNGGSYHNIVPVVEEYSSRAVSAIVGAISQMATRLEAVGSVGAPQSLDRESLVHDLFMVLSPHLASLRPEPIDYEGLTDRLTQAVKPHISQLIDLASDKQETASLIVDRLVPILPTLHLQGPMDGDTIIAKLTAEMRRIVAPLDAHEIKEQVSDLVVERLDSRLAVRDKSFNMDNLTAKVSDTVASLLQPINDVAASAEFLTRGQEALFAQNDKLMVIHNDVVLSLSDLPTQLIKATEGLRSVQSELESHLQGRPLENTTVTAPDTRHLESRIEELLAGQKALSSVGQDITTFQDDISSTLNALPDMLTTSTKVLQDAYADLASRGGSRQDQDDLRRLTTQNAELQVQLAKARGSHGQVRVEKDNLNERLMATEAERDRLRSQTEDLKSAAEAKFAETMAIQSKTSDLEEALSQALDRLKASDVAAQTQQERIAELEKSARELRIEKEQLKSKVESSELQSNLAVRDKEAAVHTLDILQREHDQLVSQQDQLDSLRRASEQMEMLTTLMQRADNEEVKELRRVRERTRVVEGEYAALQKRFKEQDSKVANSERAAATAKQILSQAQQRAADWEKQAKEAEGELELIRTRLDHAEQTHAQLDADHSLAKLQLEEKEADSRLSKDRESKLLDRISTLEAQVARLQAEVQKTPTTAPLTFHNVQNGNGRPVVSRPSSIYGPSRSVTPIVSVNGKVTPILGPGDTNSPPGVWDSIHAPKPYNSGPPMTPKARHSQYYRVPSPTPSTVSLAPTLGEDGWWS